MIDKTLTDQETIANGSSRPANPLPYAGDSVQLQMLVRARSGVQTAPAETACGRRGELMAFSDLTIT
jgi:hypothetical protein